MSLLLCHRLLIYNWQIQSNRKGRSLLNLTLAGDRTAHQINHLTHNRQSQTRSQSPVYLGIDLTRKRLIHPVLIFRCHADSRIGYTKDQASQLLIRLCRLFPKTHGNAAAIRGIFHSI